MRRLTLRRVALPRLYQDLGAKGYYVKLVET